ncbi:MAG TPA: hypothetical protein VEL76_10970 [Gemmataceae bacterium]|nr:hypothetical protein [Gemmataceae bacterium]
MAFHPLRTFQKNRKFWMASILLMCMVTFVLCTGLGGGDFGEWIMGIIRGRSGIDVVELADRTYTSKELDDLKMNRDIANEFMRASIHVVLDQIDRQLEQVSKSNPEDKLREARFKHYMRMKVDLDQRIQRARYFAGDSKLPSLINFILLRNQADRCGVTLTDDGVIKLVHNALHVQNPLQQYVPITFDTNDSRTVYAAVRRAVSARAISDSMIMDALRDEFRVLIARHMLEECPAQLLVLEERSKGQRELSWDWPLQTRMAVTPEQLHQSFVKQRSQTEVALIPLRVDHFLKDMPAPQLGELNDFFARHRDKKFDPTKEEPGFVLPERVQIQRVSAFADSPEYRHAANAAVSLQITPLTLHDPNSPLALAAASYAAHSAAWEQKLANDYEKLTPVERIKYLMAPLTRPYFALPLYTGTYEVLPPIEDPLTRFQAGIEARDSSGYEGLRLTLKAPKAEEVAALAGAAGLPQFGSSAVAGLQAAGYWRATEEFRTKKPPENDPIIQSEWEKRWQAGAKLILAGAIQPPIPASFPVGALWTEMLHEPYHFQPLVAKTKAVLRRKIEDTLAHKWARDAMEHVRAKLEKVQGGNGLLLADAVQKLKGPYGLTLGGTTTWRNQFDIANDPDMKPLLDAFKQGKGQGGKDILWMINAMEGHDVGTPGHLTEDDFYKLFFGSGAFGVGNAEAYQIRSWPPTVTPKKGLLLRNPQEPPTPIDLASLADRSFVFWKTGHLPSKAPTKLAEVQEAVEHAWRVQKAREAIVSPAKADKASVVPHLEEVVNRLRETEKKGEDLRAAIKKEAEKARDKWVLLQRVAPWVEKRDLDKGGPLSFGPYELPRNTIQYPHEDTAKWVLSLTKLEKPLETGYAPVDALNRKLFEARAKEKDKGKVIQVFANQPRTAFYVAVLMHEPRVGLPLPRPAALEDSFVEIYQKSTRLEAIIAKERGQVIEFDYPANMNTFVSKCQEEAARNYREALSRQMREQAKERITAEGRKQFEGEDKQK